MNLALETGVCRDARFTQLLTYKSQISSGLHARFAYPGRFDAIEAFRHRVHRLPVHQRVTEEETVSSLVVQVAGGGELILAGGVADLERAELPVDLEVWLPVGVIDGGVVLLQELGPNSIGSRITPSKSS